MRCLCTKKQCQPEGRELESLQAGLRSESGKIGDHSEFSFISKNY